MLARHTSRSRTAVHPLHPERSCLLPQPGYLSKFKEESLFYTFYSMPGDEAQLIAADELSVRGWWFHRCGWGNVWGVGAGTKTHYVLCLGQEAPPRPGDWAPREAGPE